MESKIRVFCDFDGVLNTILKNPNGMAKFQRITGFNDLARSEFTDNESRTFPLWMSAQRNELIHKLASMTEFVWATTWGWLGYYAELEAMFPGVGRLPLENFDDSTAGTYGSIVVKSWKEKTVLSETNGGKDPYIWIDDVEIMPWYRKNNKALGRPGLLLSPSPYYGLTRDHFDQIFAFIKETNGTF